MQTQNGIINPQVLEEYGVSADDFASFDPSVTLLNETDFKNRGIFHAPKKGNVYTDGQITINLKNNSSDRREVVELFNTLKHITKFPNNSVYASGQFQNFDTSRPFRPFSQESVLGLLKKQSDALISGDSLSDFRDVLRDRAVFSDDSGNLLYVRDGVPLSDSSIPGAQPLLGQATAHTSTRWQSLDSLDNQAQAYISCQEIPYSALVEQLGSLVLLITNWKFQFSSEAQKSNKLKFAYNTVFGEDSSNSLTPISFFTKDNFQSKLIDIPQLAAIDKRTAIYYTLEPEENMSITLSVRAYRDNGVISGGLMKK